MHRYTAFSLFLALFLVLMMVETVDSQSTTPPAASTAVTTTNQVSTAIPVTATSTVTSTPSVTAVSPVTTTVATTGTKPISGTVIGANILNVRSGPGTNFTRIATLTDGATVAIIGRDSPGIWLQIQLAEGQMGWVSSQFVRSNFLLAGTPIVGTSTLSSTGGAATATVTTSILNVRAGPGLTFAPFTTVSQGQVVSLLGRNADNSWLQVRLSDGRTGWLSSQFVIANLVLSTLPLTASP